VIIEDDVLTAGQMETAIRALGFDVWRIPTESEFYFKFDEIAAERRPAAIVIDVMLRWADPSDHIPPKPAHYEQTKGYRRAGLRCRTRIQGDERTAGIPVLIFTVLDQESLDDVPDGQYLQKGNGYERLLEWVRQATQRA
jgi:hypothetical protein